MIIKSRIRNIAGLIYRTVLAFSCMNFLFILFLVFAGESRIKLRLHASNLAPVLNNGAAIVGMVIIAVANYWLHHARRSRREEPTVALVALVAGGLLAAMGPAAWSACAGSATIAFAVYLISKAGRSQKPKSSAVGIAVGCALLFVSAMLAVPIWP
jgi:hypothetical protein